MDLTVSAIHTFAKWCSKANPKINGNSYANVEKLFRVRMNDVMTTSQFLYRTATIYKCENNVYIVPIYDQYQFISGWYPISTIGSQIVTINGKTMLKYRLDSKQYAIPYNEVIHLKSHQYKHELFGDSNSSLYPTMELISTQNQGIINGIKSSGFIRYIAKIANNIHPDDLVKMRDKFANDNLTIDNQSGMLIYDNKISELKQVESKQFVVDDKQSSHIRTNVYNYFGTNDDILQSKGDEVINSAYYESEIEPFLIQLSQGMTQKMFTDREISFENQIIWASSRLQFANWATRLQVSTQSVDRGMMTRNEAREMLNLPPVEGGDVFYIRREYADIDKLDADVKIENEEVKDDNKQ
jgi:HK97 family phage portal protein